MSRADGRTGGSGAPDIRPDAHPEAGPPGAGRSAAALASLLDDASPAQPGALAAKHAPEPKDTPSFSADAANPARSEREATLRIDELGCRACARHAERALRSIEGVRAARVGFVGEIAQIVYDVRRTSEREIAQALARAGYRVGDPIGVPQSEQGGVDRARLTLAIAALGHLLAVSALAGTEPAYRGTWFARLALALALLALGARPLLARADALLRRGVVGRDAMVIVTALGAFAVGLLELAYGSPGSAAPPPWLASLGLRVQPWSPGYRGFEAAGAVVALALVARALTGWLRQAAQRDLVLAARARSAPTRVLAEGGERIVPRDALAVGDRVRVLEAEIAPVDLRVENEARIAPPRGLAGPPGEAGGAALAGAGDACLRAGDVMPAGATLLSGSVVGRAVRAGRAGLGAALDAETHRTLARVDAETSGGPAGSFSEVAARSLSVATLAFAAFALAAHALIGGGPANVGAWLAAMAVLVGASPAAFAVAAPAARAVAVLRARAAGVAIKDVGALERLATIDVACFEKTGTVTTGDLRVTGIGWLATPDRRALEDVLALERSASHPAGRAIAAYLAARGIETLPPPSPPVESSDGIAGRVRDGLCEVGSARRIGAPRAEEAPASASLVWFARNGQPLGYFELSDTLRPCAAAALRALWQRGVASRLLSGDRPEATLAAAHRLGVPGVGGLVPPEKALHVRDLQHGGSRVLVVTSAATGGLEAHADVTVVIGSTLSPAATAASIVFTEPGAVRSAGPGLTHLPWLVDLARSLRATLRRSAAIGVAFNALVIPVAALGKLAPLHAAVLALAETMLLLASTVHLMRVRPPAPPPPPAGSPSE